jgi:lanosterol synthase
MECSALKAPQTFAFLFQSKEAPPLPKPQNAIEACRNAISFWAKLQTEDGHWADDYGGPMFLLPGI